MEKEERPGISDRASTTEISTRARRLASPSILRMEKCRKVTLLMVKSMEGACISLPTLERHMKVISRTIK